MADNPLGETHFAAARKKAADASLEWQENKAAIARANTLDTFEDRSAVVARKAVREGWQRTNGRRGPAAK